MAPCRFRRSGGFGCGCCGDGSERGPGVGGVRDEETHEQHAGITVRDQGGAARAGAWPSRHESDWTVSGTPSPLSPVLPFPLFPPCSLAPCPLAPLQTRRLCSCCVSLVGLDGGVGGTWRRSGPVASGGNIPCWYDWSSTVVLTRHCGFTCRNPAAPGPVSSVSRSGLGWNDLRGAIRQAEAFRCGPTYPVAGRRHPRRWMQTARRAASRDWLIFFLGAIELGLAVSHRSFELASTWRTFSSRSVTPK